MQMFAWCFLWSSWPLDWMSDGMIFVLLKGDVNDLTNTMNWDQYDVCHFLGWRCQVLDDRVDGWIR